MRATPPGSACAQQGSRGRLDAQRRPALGGGELELGGHRAAELAELQRLAAQLHLRVEAAQVEQVGGQRESRRDCSRARAVRSRASSRSSVLGAEVVLEQLEHPVERGQRRAQLV